MPPFVTSGAMLRCTMGASPAALVVPDPIAVATTPIATEVNTIPMANIPPFGMCMSLGNPEVAAATAAAEG
ncbi:MAG: PAAR-like protein, partial [Streptosporangiaceae bacterium]